jgi:UDPglucose 6-dehydrogenase
MRVSVIGTGYVGLVSGTCFAEIGHDVTCIDIDENKIKTLKAGESPIYEPGITELLKRNIKSERIVFSAQFDSLKDAKVIFLAVGTPSADSGQADLKYLFMAAETIAENISTDAIVVIKSTVPVGTSVKVREIIQSKTKKKFHLVNNPEFLKEGSAVEDFMRPDRVIIGHQSEEAAEVMSDLYAPLLRQGNPIYMMSNTSAEMSKYAANCFLATKISFINEIARLCDKTGADINEVRLGISSDRRIGKHFLYPGPGYGGSCFPKDVKALIYTAREHDMKLKIIESCEEVNDEQKTYMLTKIKNHYGELKGKIFSFWGAAFKANTDDVRESASIYMAKALCKEGAKVHYFDPVASDNFQAIMDQDADTKGNVIAFSNKYDCLNQSEGLITMTEWREFSFPDFDEVKQRLNNAVIFDGRNLYETKKVQELGFTYFAIGKKV